ncbi:hypothetical protein VTI74DRAFT_2888 [Chaetomium olivicolor]
MSNNVNAEPVPVPFICTFCWRRFPPPPPPPPSPLPSPSAARLRAPSSARLHAEATGPEQGDYGPRVLGREARLACRQCYEAILDLAICWVCGEVVYRGEECVSLGWCFWHRACYGCLFCGGRNVVRGVGVPEVFEHGVKQGRNGMGREIEEVPVCGLCLAVIGGEGSDGSGWVDGLGKGREMGYEATSLPKSTIYVSLRDPLGELSFKPSSTKPVPRWMRPVWARTSRSSESQLPDAPGQLNRRSNQTHHFNSAENSAPPSFAQYSTPIESSLLANPGPESSSPPIEVSAPASSPFNPSHADLPNNAPGSRLKLSTVACRKQKAPSRETLSNHRRSISRPTWRRSRSIDQLQPNLRSDQGQLAAMQQMNMAFPADSNRRRKRPLVDKGQWDWHDAREVGEKRRMRAKLRMLFRRWNHRHAEQA